MWRHDQIWRYISACQSRTMGPCPCPPEQLRRIRLVQLRRQCVISQLYNRHVCLQHCQTAAGLGDLLRGRRRRH